jgi:ribosomal protein S12 methylthiotransferase
MVEGLASLPGDFRLRLLYLHPSRVDEGVVRLLGGGGKVFPYLDMPIQHASTGVLKAMNRGCSRRDLEKTYTRLRREAPGAALRTTVMVGFPGEGRREFRELLRFLKECPFENLGCFVFDPQEGTPAARLPNPVRLGEARERRHAVMEQQQELSAGLWRERRGSITEALVLNPADSTGKTWVGRTAWQAPEADGHITLSGPARSGDLVRVEITASGTYDLEGSIRQAGPVRGREKHGLP